jgi:hypothetical protein
MDGWSRCRKPVGDTWWEINTVEAGGGGSIGGGLYRLFVLAVAVWEGAGCKVQDGAVRVRGPRAWMVSTRKPFGKQSHPSRRTGCIKRSAHSRLASTLDEGGATPGQAQLARSHGRRLSMAPATGVCSWQGPSLPGPAIGCALTSVVRRTATEHLDRLQTRGYCVSPRGSFDLYVWAGVYEALPRFFGEFPTSFTILSRWASLELGPGARVAVGPLWRWCHGVQRHLTTFGDHQLQLHIAIVVEIPIGCRSDWGLYLTRLDKRARMLAPAQPTPHEKHKDGPREPRAHNQPRQLATTPSPTNSRPRPSPPAHGSSQPCVCAYRPTSRALPPGVRSFATNTASF